MKATKFLLGALVVLTAIGGVVMADDSTLVTLTIDPSISLAVPPPITGWALAEGENQKEVATGLAVTTNAPWAIEVASALNAPNQLDDYHGYFYSATAHTKKVGNTVNGWIGFLANPLNLDGKQGSGAFVLTDDKKILASGSALGIGITVPFSMHQKVGMSDPAENDYKIALEFSASNTA